MLFSRLGQWFQRGDRALNRHIEREFNPDRKDHHWGRRKLTRDRGGKMVTMSALKRIADSSRTLRHVRKVPSAEVEPRPNRQRQAASQERLSS
jgi:hypothetical protein